MRYLFLFSFFYHCYSVEVFHWRELASIQVFYYADLCPLVTSDSTRGNRVKLCQGKFRLDIKGSSPRGDGHWNRLPKDGVTAPSMTSSRSIWTTLSMARFLELLCAGPGIGFR